MHPGVALQTPCTKIRIVRRQVPDLLARSGTSERGNCRNEDGGAWHGGMAQHKDDTNTILEAQRSKLKPPPMYKVMLLNDDYTPMEFVVIVLQKFFGMTR